jgi:hypothetical protein
MLASDVNEESNQRERERERETLESKLTLQQSTIEEYVHQAPWR